MTRDAVAADLELDPVAVEGVADGVDQPGVERLADPVRGLLGAGLDRLGQSQGDPRLAVVLGLRGSGCGRRSGWRGRGDRLDAGDHELRFAAAHPHVDRVVVERAGDLGGGLGQRLEQHHPGGGVEGEGEALGGCLCLGAAGGCGVGQVAAEAFDEGREFHDATMTSHLTSSARR